MILVCGLMGVLNIPSDVLNGWITASGKSDAGARAGIRLADFLPSIFHFL
jgi:hypothetical protein